MKPVLILKDPVRITDENLVLLYIMPIVKWCRAMGIPWVTKSLADGASLTASDYSICVIPWGRTYDGANKALLTKWVNLASPSGIPCIMYGKGSDLWSQANCLTGCTTVGNFQASRVADPYNAIVDVQGRRFFSETAGVDATWSVYNGDDGTGTLAAGFSPLFTSEAGTDAGKFAVWTSSGAGRTGANLRIFTLYRGMPLMAALIGQALTAAGVTPTPAYKFFLNVDDMQIAADSVTIGGAASTKAREGVEQFIAWLEAKGTCAVVGLFARASNVAAWAAANPLNVAAWNGTDALKVIVHNHTDMYWTDKVTNTAWLTPDQRIAKYESDIAAFEAAGITMAGRTHNGYLFLPENWASPRGRMAILKMGATALRATVLSSGANPVGGTRFSWKNPTSGWHYQGETIKEVAMFTTVNNFPANYADGDLHDAFYTFAGATSLNHWESLCQRKAITGMYKGGRVIWTHAHELAIETGKSRADDQGTLLDFLAPIDSMVQASGGWLAWASETDDYNNLRVWQG